MKHLALAFLVAGLSLVVGVAAQELSDVSIADAIRRGEQTDIKDIGLSLRTVNKGQRVAAYLLRREGESGWEHIRLQVYTPLEFIALKTAEARARYSKLAPSQVTPEMKRAVLRVYVNFGVENAVLRRSKDPIGVQPVAKQVCDGIVYFEGKVATSCLLFEYDLNSARELLESDFVITVQALGGRSRVISRDFEVAHEHLSRLPL